MDTSLIKRIPIIQILENHGILPARTNSNSWHYYAFTRNEKTPSLKVDLRKNLFIDFGSDAKGSVIDIVMLLKGFRVKEAIEYLEAFDGTTGDEKKYERPASNEEESVLKIELVTKLTHPALLNYSKSRGINNDLLVQYCNQVHYSVGEKSYFAIGFKNDQGGYELRNKLFKNCSTPKWFSHLKNGNEKLIIFEGFLDFLSLLTANQKSRKGHDFLVLNSCLLKEKIPLEILQGYSQIFLFLDNDSKGKETANYFLSSLSNATDCSSLYAPFNDVNDWLTNKK